MPDTPSGVNPDELTATPNVLVIMADQQSYNAVSALATGNREDYFPATPNINYFEQQKKPLVLPDGIISVFFDIMSVLLRF